MKAKKHSFWLNYYVAVLLALILIVPSFIFNFNISPTQAAISLDGLGTSSNPYKISSTADLTTLANWVNNGNTGSGKYFELTCNISGSGVPVIGSLVYGAERRFKGTFDGNGFSISNVNRTNNTTNQQGDLGLFGYLEGTVRNLIILNGTITLSTAGKSVGAIAGSTYGGAVIERCFNSGCTVQMTSTSMDYAQVGGLVGAAGGNTTIRYSGNMASVINYAKGTAKAGGIMGVQNEGTTTITECYNKGSITAGRSTTTNEAYAGGIIGQNGTISNCFNRGSVSAYAKTQESENGYDTGRKDLVNGFYFQYINTTYEEKKFAYAGGIAGYSNNVKNCYNTASIYGGYNIKDIRNQSFDFIYDSWQPINAGNYSIQKATKNEPVHLKYELYSGSIVGFCNGTAPSNCYSVSNCVSNYSTVYSAPTSQTMIDNLSKYVYIGTGGLHFESGSANTIASNYNYTIHFHSYTYFTAVWIPTKKTTKDENITSYSYADKKDYNITNTSITANNLGSSIWASNSLINNGYPYLKNTMWTSGAQSF